MVGTTNLVLQGKQQILYYKVNYGMLAIGIYTVVQNNCLDVYSEQQLRCK